MSKLVSDICKKIPDFRSIRLEQVQISATYNRKKRRGGLIAYVLPLRYRHGSPVQEKVRGRTVYHWAMLPHRHPDTGLEILYVIYFMLPRFYNLSAREKLETIVHELYHISPRFNGDLRWFQTRGLHGNREEYDREVARLTDLYLSAEPDLELQNFLRPTFVLAQRLFGEIRATHIKEPRPTLLKVAALNPIQRD